MAESVDATVSNTVGAIHPGSIPGPGTQAVEKSNLPHGFLFFTMQLIGLAIDKAKHLVVRTGPNDFSVCYL